jgi:hypothetical protein
MRNALLIAVVAILALGVSVTRAAVDGPLGADPSGYVLPSENAADANGLLPVPGQDLPLTAASPSGLSSAPQASVVEAIPTPTAFQAGVVLLAGLALVRGVKKLRLA